MTRAMFALSLALLLCLVSSGMAVCPPNWWPDGNVCYMFVDSRETWIAAQRACVMLGATLAEPETQNENTFIGFYSGIRLYKGVWLGGFRRKGSFVRWSGKPFPFQNWAPGEPTNLNPTTKAPENCLSILRDLSYKWNDESCETELNYVCKKTA